MIPVIDLGPYLAARPHASVATAAELGRALQDVGFFVIVNHGIPQTLIDDTFAEARRTRARRQSRREASVPGGLTLMARQRTIGPADDPRCPPRSANLLVAAPA